ncbi:hypothetical protein DFJ73DRAFT_813276 [Zopfochytrium polystomum]|nr:hypothetical protein DFJ73DRAFT_813276 [Zopfochytrium polystomum]
MTIRLPRFLSKGARSQSVQGVDTGEPSSRTATTATTTTTTSSATAAAAIVSDGHLAIFPLSSAGALNSRSRAKPSPISTESSASRQVAAHPMRGVPERSQVVVVVAGADGSSSVVPFFQNPEASPVPLETPSHRKDILAVSPASKPPLKIKSPVPLSVPTNVQSGGLVGMMDLPNELLITIGLRAGFMAAINLMRTCRRFETLLSDPAAWYDYTRNGSSDIVESEVTICTKIHTFDHLVFGLWENPEIHSQEEYPHDGTQELPCKDVPVAAEPSVFFEHMTFSEQYDFLGGVNLSMTRGGLTSSEFFDHRETLPCYKNALRAAVASGALPPSAPHGDPPAGAKIDHSCQECARYDRRKVLKSIFVFDQVPYHPRWGREGFTWAFDYPDGRRRLRIKIKPFQGVLGYCSVRDLPSVFVNCVSVNGQQLKGDEYDLFQRLVNGKEQFI